MKDHAEKFDCLTVFVESAKGARMGIGRDAITP
jgi:hypothetical protein